MIQAAIKDLSSLARKKRIVFIILIISVVCSFLVISLMTGVVKYQIRSASMGSSFNTFTVEYPEGISADELAKKYAALSESSPRTVFAANFDSSASSVVIGWYGENEGHWFVQDEGRFLTNADVESAAKVAVVSERLYPVFEFEESVHPVQVAGTDVNIIGVGTLMTPSLLFTGGAIDAYNRYAESEGRLKVADMHNELEGEENSALTETIILPISTFTDLDLGANLIRVEYSVDSEQVLEQYHTLLESFFPGAKIIDPVIGEVFYSVSMKQAIFRSAGLLILAFINIAVLYVYWLLMMRRTHTLYMVGGASKTNIIVMVLLEWFILTLLGYILFVVIQFFSMPLLEFMKIEPLRTAAEQVLCFVFIYVLSSGLMIRQIIKNAQIHSEVI